ncbi:Protein aurora borealis [Eumeta japonica]|uniref:Protein aurora borealis n=1 Tax=Eumeta variegata TaxID=151549 RepID=A0A4C1VU28_EUMVA|nr:Protein aurora borealis [Eumeta japonica]
MNDGNSSPKSKNDKTTPPTNQKIKNPFDSALIERLHMPICSPGMCKIYKKQPNGSFCWDIDQVCTLVPADIVACNSQFEPSPDPVMEKIADEVTKRSKLCYISKCLVSAQTALTLPPILPLELESILQKYSTFTQDQNFSGEYEITANGSLCRKILFEEHIDPEHYDSEQTDDEIHVENRPPSSYDLHAPVVVSPDLCGHVNLHDEFSDGCPSIAVNNKTIDAVRRIIKTERLVTYHDMQTSLGIGMSQIQSLLHKKMGMKKLCSWWIPHNLTEAQKTDRVMAKCNVYKIRERDIKFWDIVTDDEKMALLL